MGRLPNLTRRRARRRSPWSAARSQAAYQAFRARVHRISRTKTAEALSSSPALRRRIYAYWFDLFLEDDRRRLIARIRLDDRRAEVIAAVSRPFDVLREKGIVEVLRGGGDRQIAVLQGHSISMARYVWSAVLLVVDVSLISCSAAMFIGSWYFSGWTMSAAAFAMIFAILHGLLMTGGCVQLQADTPEAARSARWVRRTVMVGLLILGAAFSHTNVRLQDGHVVAARLELGWIPCLRIRGDSGLVWWDGQLFSLSREATPPPPLGWGRVCEVVTEFSTAMGR